MELVVFVGLQAAGKSTFFRERFAATHELVSKDLFRNSENFDELFSVRIIGDSGFEVARTE